MILLRLTEYKITITNGARIIVKYSVFLFSATIIDMSVSRQNQMSNKSAFKSNSKISSFPWEKRKITKINLKFQNIGQKLPLIVIFQILVLVNHLFS